MRCAISGPSPHVLAIAIIAAAGALLLAAPSAVRAADNNDGKAIECELLGGDVVAQPPGSAITACCYESGCWICDAQGNDCTFQPVADRIGPSVPGRPPRATVPGLETPGFVVK